MKKLLATTVVFALLLLLFAGCQSVYAAQQENQSTPTQAATAVTREQAIEIALADAGLTREEIYDLEAEIDRDRGITHFDVDFEKGGRDYEYEIHAETGEILYKKVPSSTPATEPKPTPSEPVTTQPPATEPAATTPPATEPEKRITRDEAVAIALAHAKLTQAEIRDLDAELDRERGVLIYEVDFEAGGYEYEYELLAETGEILRAHKERD